jgi:hypothetical protein
MSLATNHGQLKTTYNCFILLGFVAFLNKSMARFLVETPYPLQKIGSTGGGSASNGCTELTEDRQQQNNGFGELLSKTDGCTYAKW